MSDYAYDVFVSYRQVEPDETWVHERLVPRLQSDRLRVAVDYLTFPLGRPLVRAMEDAVVTSRYTLAVLSTAYFESAFTDLEAVLAHHLGLEQRKRRLVAVRLDPRAQAPLGFRAYLWLEMGDAADFEPAATRLVRELRRDPGE